MFELTSVRALQEERYLRRFAAGPATDKGQARTAGGPALRRVWLAVAALVLAACSATPGGVVQPEPTEAVQTTTTTPITATTVAPTTTTPPPTTTTYQLPGMPAGRPLS
jgi:hypothetical protein